MNRNHLTEKTPYDHLDCFGEYSHDNPLCAKHCALRLRCAIEHNQNLRMELIEDLVSVEGQILKIQ
jgi:hypothetical protein